MSGQEAIGQKCPVMQDKNVLLLNTPDNNLKKKGSSTSFLGKEPDILDSLPADHWATLEAKVQVMTPEAS